MRSSAGVRNCGELSAITEDGLRHILMTRNRNRASGKFIKATINVLVHVAGSVAPMLQPAL